MEKEYRFCPSPSFAAFEYMNINVSKFLKYLYCAGFALLAWFYLYVRNADLMYFLQDRGRWNGTMLFWQECTAVPGGLLAWLGSYLTQFFYYPALGCTMLIGLWLLTFWLSKWLYRIADEWSFLLFVPLTALLCSITQLGYWVYMLTNVDYVFYHSLGFFFSVLLSAPFYEYFPVDKKTKQWLSIAWIPLIAALFYYPFGIYALLAASIIAIRQSLASVRLLLVNLIVLFLSLLLVPFCEATGSTLMRSVQPWFYGFPVFEIDGIRDFLLEIPFYVLFLFALLFPLIGRLKSRKLLISQGVMIVVAVSMGCFLCACDVDDYNFHAEMRMQRGVEECRWDDVLREAARVKGPVTREMIMLRDIALINRGEFCSARYTYNNQSISPLSINDSVQIRIKDQASDLIYFNYGETIFAIRCAMERCVYYGFSYYSMRMLAQCAILNGERDNALKYMRLLNKTLFQRKWAERMRPYVDGEKSLQESACFRMPLKLYKEGTELVGTDDNYVELAINKKWMYTLTTDPEAQQVALGCAMIMRDQRCFWSQVQRYYEINRDKPFPTHVQEAMLFDVYERKMSGINLSFVKFDERVLTRYRSFSDRLRQYVGQGMSEEQIGRALRPEFGDTYMWDFYALRAVQTN